MTKKLKAMKFDETKLNGNMTMAEVILAQFDLVPDENNKVDVTQLYMPEEEQDKMEAWIIKNVAEFRKHPPLLVKRQFPMIRLNIFPSTVE